MIVKKTCSPVNWFVTGRPHAGAVEAAKDCDAVVLDPGPGHHYPAEHHIRSMV
jgi:hypothetical protein